MAGVLKGTHAVLENQDYEKTARSIFDSCKKIIGATAGYVALLNKDGSENEVLFLDSGGRPCVVDPNLPMPIRGFREQVYLSSKAAYCNDFSKTDWMKAMPKGHVTLDNVLFASSALIS